MDTYAWTGPGGYTNNTPCITIGTAGQYCLVTTKDGCTSTDTCCRTLTVTPRPSCTISGGVDTICSGDTTQWCGPAGMDTYAWTGPGGYTNNTPCITIGTAGQYCLVTTKDGCTSTDTCCRTLTVWTVPVVTLDPIGGTVNIGATFQFTVAATGGGLSYQWYHGVTPLSDDANISGALTDTLTIDPVGPADAGSYSCVVSNTCGSDTSGAAVLNVNPNSEATLTLTAPAGCHTGSKLVVKIEMSGATTTVVGGQYFLAYDPLVLDFDSASPGDAPFTRVISEDVNETLGEIDYSTGIESGGTGTSDNTTMAYFSFNVLQDVCTLTSNLVTWRVPGTNGADNQLSDADGFPVTANVVDLGAVKIDTTEPEITCPGNVTVDCTATTQPAGTGTATATDNCGGTVTIGHSDSIASGSCAGNYVITRTWTATDECGNTASCPQTITVTDTHGPVITCPANTAVNCAATTQPAGTGMATATDDCSGVASITYSDSIAAGSCAGDYVITRTWTAADNCGNASSCNQTITVTDTHGPTVTCPASVTVDCAATTQPAGTGTPTVTDDCSGVASVSFSDSIALGSCAGNYVISRTWSAIDNCGNASSTCVQTITVQDTHGPTISCPPNTTVDCAATTQPSGTGSATATDDCSGVASITHSDSIAPGSCAGNYVITRTWTATDHCGNSSSCPQTITVTDTHGPVVTCPANVSVNCTASTQPADTGTATASDDCSGVASITYNDAIAPGSCAGNYVITRTWTAMDNCGNASSCPQTITVTDTTGPVVTCPANVSVNCTASTQPADTGTATAVDNCSGVASISHSDSIAPGSCAGNYVITRTWSATDNCGNASATTCNQTITVTDATGPVVTCPANVSVNCTASTQPADTGTATATDDCSGVANISHSDVIAPGGCAGNYVITRTWTATDNCGNSSSCAQTITVTDTTGPTITSCPGPNIAVHSAAGTCLSAPVTYSGAATDDCSGVASITFSPPSGTEFPVGMTTVTMTATDGCGNPTQCQFTVTNDGQNVVTVDVELGGGVMDAGSFDRCITFELWNGGTMAYSTSQTYTFTGGNIAPQMLLVPCSGGPYTCITARDRLHTLRRTINFSPGGYTANFIDAKKLIGGNFNNDKFIDILDFGIYTLQDLTNVGKNTSCSIVPPTRHTDVNGDGISDSVDFGFVANNFLKIRDPNCDGSTTTVMGGDDDNDGPVTRIAVADLAKIGMADIAPADLNRDGWLDQADIQAYLNGVRPQQPVDPKPQPKPIGPRPGGGFQTTGGSVSDVGP